MSDELPLEISNDERIGRAIKVPAHYDNRKRRLKTAAFRPAPETNLVSVMRGTYLSVDQCKALAKAASKQAEYLGLAQIGSGEVRECGPELVDARDEFWGHAHIVHEVTPPRGEPLPPEVQARFDATLRCLRDKATFYPDPDPAAENWSGEALAD